MFLLHFVNNYDVDSISDFFILMKHGRWKNTLSAHLTILFSLREERNSSLPKVIFGVRWKGQCQNWFKKFNAGDFLVIDKQRSGRPIEVCDNVINDIIDRDRHTTTRGTAEKLNVLHTCIEKRLQQMDYQKKFDLWILYDLTETHLTQRINICDFCSSSVTKMSPFWNV